jgi:hypothetical protein
MIANVGKPAANMNLWSWLSNPEHRGIKLMDAEHVMISSASVNSTQRAMPAGLHSPAHSRMLIVASNGSQFSAVPSYNLTQAWGIAGILGGRGSGYCVPKYSLLCAPRNSQGSCEREPDNNQHAFDDGSPRASDMYGPRARCVWRWVHVRLGSLPLF